MRIKMVVACHKKCDVPSDRMYLPVFVGSAGKEDIGFVRDDTGANISIKNPLYCELTGLYWAWKNLEYDYLGLVHYRRYFTKKSVFQRKKEASLDDVLTEEEAKRLLEEYDVILPKKRHYYIETIYSHFDHTFDGKQFDVAQDVLDEFYPGYGTCFRKYMQMRSGYTFNMFIMRADLADRYCTWLFDVLEKIEERYDTTGLTDFEKRYIGRVSERLLNAWLMYETEHGVIAKRKIHEIPYFYLGKVQWSKKIGGFLKAKLFHQKYKQSF